VYVWGVIVDPDSVEVGLEGKGGAEEDENVGERRRWLFGREETMNEGV
jgi:hypothetical protein